MFGQTCTGSVLAQIFPFVTGKGLNIWDEFCLDGRIAENHTAFVSCDSYHHIDDDVSILKELGVRH